MNNQNELNVKIDLKKDTVPVYNEDGNMVFQEAVIFRKASGFLTGQKEDSIIPISVFIDVKTGKVLKELLPKQLWSEFGYTEEEIPTTSPIIGGNGVPNMRINKDDSGAGFQGNDITDGSSGFRG